MNVGCATDVEDRDIVVPLVWDQVYARVVPSGSLDPDASRVTVSPSDGV